MTSEDAGNSAAVRRTAARFGLGLLALVAASCSKGDSDEAQANFSSDPETAKIERIVHDYLVKHPDVIFEEALAERERRSMAKLIEPHRKDIETPFAGAWAGARDGDVTLVEFFDYACTYCRANNPIIARILKEDRNLKIVWRELPVLGPNSLTAAEASLAAAKQGKFTQFHDQLFAAGQLTPDAIERVQKAVGVVPMKSNEFEQEIEKNNELARNLGTTGTPTFVVGDKILFGLQGYEQLKEAIADARKKA
jgi:protein-disulfide isomerase